MKSYLPDAQPSSTATEQACWWLSELTAGGDAQQPEQFLSWLRRSPENVEEFLLVTAVWKNLQQFGLHETAQVERVLAQAEAEKRGSSNVVPVRADSHFFPDDMPAVITPGSPETRVPPRSARTGLHRSRFMAAAAACIVGLAIWSAAQLFTPSSYRTKVGEQRVVRLEDGSKMQLNVGTLVNVRFSRDKRSVQLVSGEASFIVAHDARRPFLVETERSRVEALGTDFNVYRREDGDDISVVEGEVQVSTSVVTANTHSRVPRALSPHPSEQASHRSDLQHSQMTVATLRAGDEALAASGGIRMLPSPDLYRSLAWREGHWNFRAERLEEVVAEVNRYTSRPFRIENIAARDVRITAFLDCNRPEMLAKLLTRTVGLTIEERPDVIIIR
jgi:transmembrane sensor